MKQTLSTGKQTLSTREAADLSGVYSARQIAQLLDQGLIKGLRLPKGKVREGVRRILRESLIVFMREKGLSTDHLGSGRKKILVVDDDPEVCELFVDVLERDGRFEVYTALSGYDAGVLSNEHRPDLLIIDYMLPDVNINVICTAVKAMREVSVRPWPTKILVISGVVNQDEINDMLKAGAAEFIKKPFNIEKVIARIAELTGVATSAT